MSKRRFQRRKQKIDEKKIKHWKPEIWEDCPDGKPIDYDFIEAAKKEIQKEVDGIYDETSYTMMLTTFNTIKLIEYEPKFTDKLPVIDIVFKHLTEHHSHYYLQKRAQIEKGRDEQFASYYDFLYDCFWKNKSHVFEHNFVFLINDHSFANLFTLTEKLLEPMYRNFPDSKHKLIRLYNYNIVHKDSIDIFGKMDVINLTNWNLNIEKTNKTNEHRDRLRSNDRRKNSAVSNNDKQI